MNRKISGENDPLEWVIMNILDKLDELVSALIHQLGLAVQIPGLVLGVGLVVLAIVLYRNVQDSRGKGKPAIGTRIVAGAAMVIGLPILLAAIGTGATDSLLWSFIALTVAGFWLAGEKGKMITFIGIVIGFLAIAAVIGISQPAPADSVIATAVRSITHQASVLWTNLVHHN